MRMEIKDWDLFNRTDLFLFGGIRSGTLRESHSLSFPVPTSTLQQTLDWRLQCAVVKVV